MSTEEEGGEIQISDLHFMRRDSQPIELLFGDPKFFLLMLMKKNILHILS
jgi:hypothetical protein